MGYFSNLIIDGFLDRSYPSVEMQLQFQIMELEARLETISAAPSSDDGHTIPVKELNYVLPEHLTYVNDIEEALEKAKCQLLQMRDESFLSRAFTMDDLPCTLRAIPMDGPFPGRFIQPRKE